MNSLYAIVASWLVLDHQTKDKDTLQTPHEATDPISDADFAPQSKDPFDLEAFLNNNSK